MKLKISVSLKNLRAATKYLKIRRVGLRTDPFGLSLTRRGAKPVTGNKFIQDVPIGAFDASQTIKLLNKRLNKIPAGQVGAREELTSVLAKVKQVHDKVYLGQDPYKLFRKSKIIKKRLSGKEREMFNRAVISHEGRELRELKRLKGKAEFFESHANVMPALQDLNIAATSNKPRVGKAIRKLRSTDVRRLRQIMPSVFKRLKPGRQRLSRHAIKRIEQIRLKQLKADKVRPMFYY